MQYFTIYDYTVFWATIVVSLAIGFFFYCHGNSNKTTSDFIVGSRKQNVLPLAISLMVSFESSIMVLGMPAEAYVNGLMYILSLVGFMFALIIAAFIYARFFHELGITSIYEYYSLRFNSHLLRNIGTIMGILSYVWYMGIVLYGPGIALQAVTGFTLWHSILLVTASSVLYTAIGGIKAVIWTDVFQAIIMYTSLIAGFVKGVHESGGITEVMEIAKQDGRLNFDTRFDPWVRHTVWGLLFGNFLRAFNTVFNQSTFQRVSAAKSTKGAIWVLLLTGPLYAITTGFAIFQGVASYAYFKKQRCDPLASGQLTNPNQIMPLYMMRVFESWPGMPGLFVAGLFSASLSTLSSGLSSMSTLTWVDIIKPKLKSNVSDLKGIIACKVGIVFYGIVSMGIAFLISMIDGTLTQIGDSLSGSFAAPIAGLMIFATLCPWAEIKGALIGTIVSVIVTSWIALGSVFSTTRYRTPRLPPAPIDHCSNLNITSEMLDKMNNQLTTMANETSAQVIEGLDWLYSLSYTLIAPIGMLLVLIIGTAVSLPTYNPHKVNKRYLVPLADKICCCFQTKSRMFLEDEKVSAQKTEIETFHSDLIEKETSLNGNVYTVNSPSIDHRI